MDKRLFVSGLLLLLVSCAFAQQKKVFNPPPGTIRLLNEVPAGWGRSMRVEIRIFDGNNKEVKKTMALVSADREIPIDIRSLRSGHYSMLITAKDPGTPVKEVEKSFIKNKGQDKVILTFVGPKPGKPHAPKPPDDPRPVHAEHQERQVAKKPVIYLYPEKPEDVAVKVHFKGKFIKTIPDYGQGWNVKAAPDGTITNYADGKKYPYLFWEGATYKQEWNMQEGFVVSADNSREFLERVLPEMGLTAKEYNEFIDFWAPILQKNEYNLIHFAGSEYEDMAKLEVSPKPDAVLRVFLVFKSADKNTRVVPQHFDGFVRKGFTVVEWGGMELTQPRTAKE